MARKYQHKGKARLMIDFKNEKALKEFAVLLKQQGFIPEHGGVYRADGLDVIDESGGVSVGNSFVVKAIADRGENGRVV